MMTLAIAVPGNKDEFIRQARLFQAYWMNKGEQVDLVILDKANKANWRMDVRHAILAVPKKLDRFAVFCHGTPKELLCGFNVLNVDGLATVLRRVSNPKLTVALYACSCGRMALEWPWGLSAMSWERDKVLNGDGFAANLMAELILAGVQPTVFAHHSKGHTTHNPYCYRYTYGNNLIFRLPIVEKKPKEAWKQWIADMQTERRFEVPFEV